MGSSGETPDDPSAAPIPSFEVSTGTVSRLQEDENRFWIAGVLENEPTRLKIAYVEWRKTPFQTWWASAEAGLTLRGNTDGSAVSLPRLLAPPCTVDSWAPIQPRLPSGRYRHTAVWTGSEMIVWGGTPTPGKEGGTILHGHLAISIPGECPLGALRAHGRLDGKRHDRVGGSGLAGR